MRKKILIVGCSFSHKVWDVNNNVEQCWVDYISKELGDKIYVMNLSMPGTSNELIKRTVTKKILEENWDHVIVQWSTIDRWDYPTTNHDDDENKDLIRYCPYGSRVSGTKDSFYKEYLCFTKETRRNKRVSMKQHSIYPSAKSWEPSLPIIATLYPKNIYVLTNDYLLALNITSIKKTAL